MRNNSGRDRKDEPVRTCLSCRGKQRKKDLLRFVADRKGHIFFDEKGRMPGRGVYSCPDDKCLSGFVNKSGMVAKALRRPSVEYAGILDLLKSFREEGQNDIN